MHNKRLLIVLILLFSLISCDINSSAEKVKRTYPEAFSLETVTIQEILYEVEVPDSLNIKAHVIDIFECSICAPGILPERIGVWENLPPADTLYINVLEPRQFQKQKYYLISLRVTEREVSERNEIQLLGYSLIE